LNEHIFLIFIYMDSEILNFLLIAGISFVGLLILLWFFPITLWFQALI